MAPAYWYRLLGFAPGVEIERGQEPVGQGKRCRRPDVWRQVPALSLSNRHRAGNGGDDQPIPDRVEAGFRIGPTTQRA